MTDQELRRLSRAELLEMLLSQSRECERLQKELDDVKAQLASREIRISEAGSIAEASLQLSGVFEAAQAACAQYIENIEQMKARQELVCAEMEEATRKKCAQMVAEAEAQSKD